MPLRKLVVPEGATTEELIRAIERKDRRFRVFQFLFMVGTFVLLIFIIAAQQRTLSEVQHQVQNDAKIAEETREQRTNQLDNITRRLDCMVVFFSTPNRDRDNLTIENVETCALNKDQDLNKFFRNEPKNNSENPPNLQGSVSPSSTPATPATPSGSTNTSATQDDEDSPAERRPPLQLDTPILDLLLGVPQVNIGIR